MCVHCTCWNASETIARMEEGSLNSVLRCIFLWSANYKVYWCTLQQGRVLVSFGIFCCFFLLQSTFWYIWANFEQILTGWGLEQGEQVPPSSNWVISLPAKFHYSSPSLFSIIVLFLRCVYWNPHHKGVAQWWQEPGATLEQASLPEMPGSTIPKFGSSTLKINIYFKTNWPPIVFTAFHTRSHWSFAFSSHYDVLCGLNRGLGREKGNN